MRMRLRGASLRWVPFIGQGWPLTSLSPAGGTGFGLNVDLMGSSGFRRAMWPDMAVPPEDSSQADLIRPAIAVSMKIHLLVLDCALQLCHKDVVVADLSA